MIRTAQGGDVDNKDTKTYGVGFWDAYRRVHLPDSDPNKLTDPSALYPMAGPGGGLTVAGVDKLSAEISGQAHAGRRGGSCHEEAVPR